MKHLKRNISIALTLGVTDQFFKWLIEWKSPDWDWEFLWIHEVRNTGASFGILQDNSMLLALISFAVLVAIIVNYKKIPEKYTTPVAIITGGIIGNFLDRVFRGYVVDFFDLRWWPAFNVADACIFIGVTWLVVLLFQNEPQNQKN